MKYKIVIFDLDGTILNTLEDLADSTNYALSVFDMPERTIEEIRHFVGNGIRKLMERAVPQGTPESMIVKVHETFTELEAVQFDHCDPYYKDRVWGLFGDNDAIAHFCPLFLEHYNQAFHFPGGHTPTEQEVKTWYAPLAQKMMMEFSAKEERFIKTI